MALEFCSRYAPQEVMLVELNKNEIVKANKEKASSSSRYAEALGLGVVEEVLLPTVLFVLSGIASNIISDAYKTARAQFTAYLCSMNTRSIADVVGNDQRARTIIAKLREMLCDDGKESDGST